MHETIRDAALHYFTTPSQMKDWQAHAAQHDLGKQVTGGDG